MFKIKSLVLVGVGVLALGAVAHAQTAEDYVANRSKLMRSNSAAVKAIKAAVAKNDYKNIATRARSVANAMEMNSFAKSFAPNTIVGKSRAKAAIWSNWKDFMGHAYDAQQAALALAEAADAKDDGNIAASFKSLGATCNSCHKPYRGPRKK